MRFLMLLMICTVMAGCAQNSISALNDKINDIKKAAAQGDARAQTNIGAMYENGRGVPQDEEQAIYWYRKAVEQGDGRAQRYLRWMCPKIGCK